MSPEPANQHHGRRVQPPWQPPIDPVDSPFHDGAGGAHDAWFLPRDWDRKAVAIYVWGTSRPIVNRVVFSLARSLDATPLWLEMLERGEEPDPLRLGWVPRERLYLSERPEDMEPARAVGNLALWNIVRFDEPASLLARLTDFVRLPPLVQEALAASTTGPRLRALAVGNADRVEHLFHDRSEELQWLIQYLRESSLCLVVGATTPPGVGRAAFDYEFRVEGVSMEEWRSATIVCDRCALGGACPVGRAQPLARIPGLTDLFLPDPRA